MDDGSFYAEIPLLGLRTNMPHLEECQCRIREMLEEHIRYLASSRHNALTPYRRRGTQGKRIRVIVSKDRGHNTPFSTLHDGPGYNSASR